MGKFNEYSQKATPEDADSLMIYDAAAKANKLSPFSGIWNWIVGKLTNAVISNLETQNKSVVGALNELNSNPVLSILASHIYYSDTQVSEFGGFDNCVIDAIKNKLPKDGTFYSAFTAGHRYLMLGYLYAEGKYGIVKLFDYQNESITYNISDGNIEKIPSKVFVNTRNLSTFSVNIELNTYTYASFLMYGATSRYNGFMYIVFVDVKSEKRAVNFIKIADFVASRTFSGTYSDDTSTLTINASETIWGGIKMLMLK